MNRKLQHTMQALSASAAVLGLMLIAGGPAPVSAPAPAAGPAMLLVASAEAAGSAVEAMDAQAEPAADVAAPAPRRHRRGHATTALPYFSFAQGLRQVAGG